MSPLPRFQLQIRRVNDQAAIVEIHGDMDMQSSPQAKAAMLELLEQGCRHLLINLQHAEYLDSTALGAFVGLLKRAREHGGDVRLVSPSSRVRRLLEITRLTFAFHIYASENEALERLPQEGVMPS